MNRKSFLNVAGWFAVLSFIGTATIGALRLMVPRVLYEAPSAFKAGFPEDFVVGEVNEKYKDDFRVWIVRETEGFLRALGDLYTSGMHAPLAPVREQVQVPVPRERVSQGRGQFRGPDTPPAGAPQDYAGRRRPDPRGPEYQVPV